MVFGNRKIMLGVGCRFKSSLCFANQFGITHQAANPTSAYPVVLFEKHFLKPSGAISRPAFFKGLYDDFRQRLIVFFSPVGDRFNQSK